MFERLDKTYDKDSLQTPKYIYRWLNTKYDFDFDLTASDENSLAGRYFTQEDNALSKNWRIYGETGFCNPPYSKKKGMKIGHVDLFVKKAIEQSKIRFTTVMLIPELNGEARTRDIMTHARKIYHFDKRISFIHPMTGKECTGNNRGSIVVEFGINPLNIAPVHILINLDVIKSQYA